MYKLIATDLDGTLLNNSNQVPEANKEYIKKAMELGVVVALCSGRSYHSLNIYEEMLGLNKRGGYGICFNGGIVYDAHKKEIVSDIRMDRDTALEIITEIKPVLAGKKADILMYAGEDLYVEAGSVNENTQSYATRSKLELKVLEDFEQVTESVSKVLLRGLHEVLLPIHEHMFDYSMGRAKMFFTQKDLLEFVPLESGKGRGLEILAKTLGIPMSQVIAVGDQVNDLEMIEAAGLGVAVRNAVDTVKAAADYVAQSDNNEGVIKEIVERFIYGNSTFN